MSQLLHGIVDSRLGGRGCGIGFGICLVLALAIEGLDFFDFKTRIAVVADELLLGTGKVKGAATRGALIVDTLEAMIGPFAAGGYAPMAPPQYSQRPLASGNGGGSAEGGR